MRESVINAESLLAAICLICLSACSDLNTKYADGFSKEQLDDIEIGMSVAEVEDILGKPVKIVSVVEAPNGNQSSYEGRFTDIANEESNLIPIREVFNYTRQIDPMLDYQMIQISFSHDGKVIKINIEKQTEFY